MAQVNPGFRLVLPRSTSHMTILETFHYHLHCHTWPQLGHLTISTSTTEEDVSTACPTATALQLSSDTVSKSDMQFSTFAVHRSARLTVSSQMGKKQRFRRNYSKLVVALHARGSMHGDEMTIDIPSTAGAPPSTK